MCFSQNLWMRVGLSTVVMEGSQVRPEGSGSISWGQMVGDRLGSDQMWTGAERSLVARAEAGREGRRWVGATI